MSPSHALRNAIHALQSTAKTNLLRFFARMHNVYVGVVHDTVGESHLVLTTARPSNKQQATVFLNANAHMDTFFSVPRRAHMQYVAPLKTGTIYHLTPRTLKLFREAVSLLRTTA